MLKIFNLYITDLIVFYSNKAFVSIRNFNATYIWPKIFYFITDYILYNWVCDE